MALPGEGSKEFYSVQGEEHDQLMDSSWIGLHQGKVLSIINLLVSSSLGSVFLWSAVFIFLYKRLRNVCQVFISFRELGVQGFCYVAEAQSKLLSAVLCFYIITFPNH